MRFYIVIPAYNEADYLAGTLKSLMNQTLLPEKIVVVNDSSTDTTQEIIDAFSEKYPGITAVFHNSAQKHLPGGKVIDAFYKGFESLDSDFDVICKFDADLIFPENYLETIAAVFNHHPKAGLAGGICLIQKNKRWIPERLTDADHLRGALKAYRKQCFEQIGGLKKSMGWDTADELLARYHGWEIKVNPDLAVKHLKPTGEVYSATAFKMQGEAFYKLRYGFILTVIASAKLAVMKKQVLFFFHCLRGFLASKRAKTEFLLSDQEGKFVRQFRWKRIREKLSRR